MTRVLAILFAAFVAAAPLTAAAQSHSRGDRSSSQERRISEAQAQMIAQSRAGGARYVGSRGLRGNSYVFLFERRDGTVFEVTVSASGGF